VTGAVGPVAAIDCGTNSIRLLIAYREGPGLVELDRRTMAVRLGEGVDQNRVLAPQALRRTWDACETYREVIERSGAKRIRFVATSATRDASNSEEFVMGVRDRLGVEPEVISGEREAVLSFDGATRGMRVDNPTLVFDIGGGSTEFVLGGGSPREWASVNMGCVRFTERFVDSDPLNSRTVAAVESAVSDGLDSASQEISWGDAQTLIGLAGTVTTVAALALRLSRYDSGQIHGARLDRKQVEGLIEFLVSATTAQRCELAVMKPGRADVIVAGALILRGILARCSTDTLVVSEHDILDGLVWSLASAER
jgi:exopolyphosphatase/guanosine-5'-triphosphate,3'-diphosphate pyrophosphatase